MASVALPISQKNGWIKVQLEFVFAVEVAAAPELSTAATGSEFLADLHPTSKKTITANSDF